MKKEKIISRTEHNLQRPVCINKMAITMHNLPTVQQQTPSARNPCQRRHSGRATAADGTVAARASSRRQHLTELATLPSLVALSSSSQLAWPAAAAEAVAAPAQQQQQQSPPVPALVAPNYAAPGPFQALRLPNLEHTCTTCDAPAERCRLKIHAWVPKGGARLGVNPPYPLAIITPGFLLAAHQYTSYAERLASWGYVAVTYDRTQAALDPVSDVVCVAFLRDLMDWCRTSVPLGALCDSTATYLIGHSRGGKISALAAVEDPRVQAVFLLDPVDVTVYAPLSPEFPSATAALSGLAQSGRSLPLAVVGSGRGGDCVPQASNFKGFFLASNAPTWEAVITDAGHLQFLDARGGSAMDFVCAAGKTPDAAISEVTRAMMVAWGETMVRRPVNASSSGEQSSSPDSSSSPSSSSSDRRFVMGVDSDGKIVAEMASFSALQALYATEEAFKKKNGGAGVEVATRLKNFDLTF